MQPPTLQNVRIRSVTDAFAVFNGVARAVLPLIVRRLDPEERRAIAPGNVYVWEERLGGTSASGEFSGMERWTDGMGWGPSRVRDGFLFYHQRETDPSETGEDSVAPSTPWSQMIRVYSASRTSPLTEEERLIKQTYSVLVSLPEDKLIVRKWHLTAYFSQETLNSLATLDTIAGVGDVAVPSGWFRSARAGTRRGNRDSRAHVQIPITSSTAGRSGATSSSSQPNRQSPSSSSSSHSPDASPNRGDVSIAVGDQLAPLECLYVMSYPRRDPADEQLLMRFSRIPRALSGSS